MISINLISQLSIKTHTNIQLQIIFPLSSLISFFLIFFFLILLPLFFYFYFSQPFSFFYLQFHQLRMAIDLIRGGRIPNRGFKPTKSSNAYLKTLIKLYAFLTRRTSSRFNKVIHKRLNQSRLNRYPISLSRVSRILGKDAMKAPEGKTAFNSRIVAVVGTITNDNRLINLPEGLRVCALKFTAAARKRITQAKGQCLTFDQLAQIAPQGKDVLLLRGPRDREAKRHFGLYPGQKGSHAAPRVRCEGRKWERARGRR